MQEPWQCPWVQPSQIPITLLILFILCVCTYIWWHVHTDVHVEVRAQLGINSLLYVHPRDGTQAVRSGGRSLYTLSWVSIWTDLLLSLFVTVWRKAVKGRGPESLVPYTSTPDTQLGHDKEWFISNIHSHPEIYTIASGEQSQLRSQSLGQRWLSRWEHCCTSLTTQIWSLDLPSRWEERTDSTKRPPVSTYVLWLAYAPTPTTF